MYGILHGMGGASVALNLATIAYIGDISSPETKVGIRIGIPVNFFVQECNIKANQNTSLCKEEL